MIKNDKNKCQKAWDNLDKNGYICFYLKLEKKGFYENGKDYLLDFNGAFMRLNVVLRKHVFYKNRHGKRLF